MFESQVKAAGPLLNVATEAADGRPPLLLWHGVGRCWRDFVPLLPTLITRWSVRAVDHRGHGFSERVSGRYFVPDYVADAAEVLRETADEPTVLYGHSLGALAALGAAAAIPTHARAVVLEDPPSAGFLARVGETDYARTWPAMRALAGSRDVRATAAALAAVRLRDGRTLGDVRNPAALRFLARCLADLDPEVLTPPIEGNWLAGYDLIETARRVSCPVLLLAADPAAGGMLPAADAAALTAAADVTRVDFPGRGHLLHGDHPDAVIKVLLPFLESL